MKIGIRIKVKFDTNIDKIECIKSSTTPKELESYLAIIPGETLYWLYWVFVNIDKK